MLFLLRLAISAFSLGVAARLIPGIHVRDWTTLFLAAFLLGIVNAIIKPRHNLVKHHARSTAPS